MRDADSYIWRCQESSGKSYFSKKAPVAPPWQKSSASDFSWGHLFGEWRFIAQRRASWPKTRQEDRNPVCGSVAQEAATVAFMINEAIDTGEED